LRRCDGIVGQPECGGEIISSSDGENRQEHISAECCIRQRLKRSVPAHCKERSSSLQYGILRDRLELCRTARHYKLRMNVERFE
jgi:hypothetical protein